MSRNIDLPYKSAVRPANVHYKSEEEESSITIRLSRLNHYGVKVLSGNYKPPKGFRIVNTSVQEKYTLLWIQRE